MPIPYHAHAKQDPLVGRTFHVSPTLLADTQHVSRALKFDHCTFKEPLRLTRAKFHNDVIFRSCRFERYVDFTDSCFFHGVSFEDCSFDEKAYFERVTFGPDFKKIIDDIYGNAGGTSQIEHVRCTRCECDLVQLAQTCHPMSCNTEKHDHGSKACANFRAAVFNDGAEFDYAIFHVPACFHKTTWHKATTFLQCQFPLQRRYPVEEGSVVAENIINFSHAQISGSVEFNQSLRPSNERHNNQAYKYGEVSDTCIVANFKYIHVHKEHGLRFHTENLNRCSVLGTNLDACHFSNVRWPKVKTYYPLALRVSFAFLKSLLNPETYQKQNAGGAQAPKVNGPRCIAIAIRKVPQLLYLAPLHAVHKILSWAVRFPTRWIVAHRSDDKDSKRPSTVYEYCKSCWTLKQYCIWDHEKQNLNQNDELPIDCSRKTTQKIEDEVSSWRNRWALLSRAYRDLKAAYEGNKDYIYASDFHYAEKEFRRINYEVPRQIRIQLQLYWLVSGYGERVLRPIWWFLLIWILGAFPYACSDQVKLDEQASVRATQSR